MSLKLLPPVYVNAGMVFLDVIHRTCFTNDCMVYCPVELGTEHF